MDAEEEEDFFYPRSPPPKRKSTRTAFVHQKELLYGYLTPREHLTFHAFTRMSREYTREALLARVEEVGGCIHVVLLVSVEQA